MRLTRFRDTGNATLGILSCKGEEFVTIEPSWMFNIENISCIPEGTYKVTKRYSKTFGNHLHIEDVDNRTLILIHAGNYFKDTKGCIIVGSGFEYIDGDNHIDVKNSRVALDRILELCMDEGEIEITRHEHYQRWCR